MLEAAGGSGPHLVVEPAGTLAEALAEIGRRPFDVVLLDLTLPDAFGFAALEAVAAAAPWLPVVVLTGRDEDDLSRQLMQRGAQDYLVKGEIDGPMLRRTLRHAVERKRLLVENASLAAFPREAPHPILAFGRSGELAYANPAANRLIAELGAEDLAAVLPAEHERLMRECLHGESAGPRAIAERNGRVFSWAYQSSADGGLIHCYVTEITDWARAEADLRRIRDDLECRVAERTAALQRNEQVMRLVSDALPALIAYVDSDRRYQLANRRYWEWLGVSPAGMVGQRIETVAAPPFLNESGELRVDEVLAGREVAYEGVLISPDLGTRQFYAIHVPHFDREGRVLGFFSLIQDITELKRAEEGMRRSEEKYRALMNHAADAILVADGDGCLIEGNRRAEELLGYGGEELAGLPLMRLYRPEDEGRVNQILAELAGTGVVRVPDIAVVRRDGGEVPVDVAASMVTIGGRRVIQGILKDISLHKRIERELRGAKESAELADRAKSEFLANMSHELRTPLNAIIGFADVMRQELMGPLPVAQYRDYVRDIYRSGRHLLDLINEILDMSKIESGLIELHCEPVSVVDLVKTSLRLISERAAQAKVRLSVELPLRLPAIRVDERRMKQVLLNLLSNAVKFTPPGGRVAVGAAARSDGGLMISVTDSGIGMDAEGIATALKPFGQVESALSRRYDGTGLGLPLTKAFVELHDGRLVLESAPGKGTSAIVELPPERISP